MATNEQIKAAQSDRDAHARLREMAQAAVNKGEK